MYKCNNITKLYFFSVFLYYFTNKLNIKKLDSFTEINWILYSFLLLLCIYICINIILLQQVIL